MYPAPSNAWLRADTRRLKTGFRLGFVEGHGFSRAAREQSRAALAAEVGPKILSEAKEPESDSELGLET